MSPFKALYGRDPPTLFKWKEDSSMVEEVNIQLQERNELLNQLKMHLEQAQIRMKEQANQKRRDVEFDVGDEVYLRIQPYKLKSLAKKQHEKLAPRFYGPYPIIERIGKVAYKLKLPDTARVHPVFHVSQLKKSPTATITAHPLPVYLSEEYELQVQPEQVRKKRRMTDGKWQVLIRWKDLPECDCTWEDMDTINDQFPDFHLEDKVKLAEGGNDGPVNFSGHTYSRRRPKGDQIEGRNRKQARGKEDMGPTTNGGPNG